MPPRAGGKLCLSATFWNMFVKQHPKQDERDPLMLRKDKILSLFYLLLSTLLATMLPLHHKLFHMITPFYFYAPLFAAL